MRIHRLEMCAFGPFATVQEIDFDALASQGLFLLNGATGAGKTSVLDAICFALYGSVPGARQDGKRLRSDHAAPDMEPRVVCEFSARGRRFEVTRIPAWDRPSTRGRSGFTPQKAKTLLREKVDGTWVEKTYRNDEAGAEITALLGMDREQFTRVVMLPQGDFAAFLRSKAGERMELLQKLFGTYRFEAIEQELGRQAAAARMAMAEYEQGLKLLLDRAEGEAASVLSEESRAGAGDAPDPQERIAGLEAAAQSEERRRHLEAGESKALASGLSDKLRQARERATRHTRLRAAMVRQEDLAGRRPEVMAVRQRLATHHRAAVLGGQLAAVDAAVSAVAAARREARNSMNALVAAGLDSGDLGSAALAAADLAEGALDPENIASETVDRALRRVQETAAVLEARLGEEKQRSEVELRIGELESSNREHKALILRFTQELAQLASEANAHLEAIALLESESARMPELEAAAEAARSRRELTIQYAAATNELGLAQDSERNAAGNSQRLRQAWLDLREARLTNAAAELAAGLAAGAPCPVCGSCDHPSPAPAAPSVLTIAEEEEAARARFEESDSLADAAAARRAAAERSVAVLAAQGGDIDPEEASRAELSAKASLDAARAAHAQLLQAKQRLEKVEANLGALQEAKAATEAALVQDQAAVVMLKERRDSLDQILGGLRAGHPTLHGRLDALRADLELLESASAAAERLDRVLERAASAETALADALPGAGFHSAEQARSVLMEEVEAAAAEGMVRQYDAEVARLEELFASDDLVLAAAEDAEGEPVLSSDELSSLEAQAQHASEEVRRIDLAAGLAAKAAANLTRIRAEYKDREEAGQAPREHATMLNQLADTARGSGDNNYRMSLNSYVLAARLEQVAAAASVRLTTMSDGRYTLRHTDAKAARGQKSGLGLEVVDEWTGQHRDTSTLSGGESFMASLSLALGLADVVQQEAGGVDIETLFVDEGFGSLDEQALEQVMDALEGLREGGRVVGLVSHVAEMKQRIGSQLQVIKGRNGSSVQVTNTAA